MTTTRKNIADAVRAVTRKALERGELDRAALRRVARKAMHAVQDAAQRGPRARQDLAHAQESLKDLERLFLETLAQTARAGKGAASQGMNATLASGAVVARIASGMLAGVADSLAGKPGRRLR